MWAFLSARFRRYVLFAVVLPLVGRLLEALGLRVAARNPRAGSALRQAGQLAQAPVSRRSRRRWSRRRH